MMASMLAPSRVLLAVLLLLSLCCTESYSSSEASVVGAGFCAVRPSSVPRLSLRGGYDNGYDQGYGGGGGGYDRGYGDDDGYRGGYGRGYRGGYRGRGRGRGRRAPPDGPIDELKLYVGGLAWEVDDQALQEAFSAFGECEAKVMLDKYSGRSRGFGFVTFTDVEACNAARDAMNGKEIQGRAVAVNNARQRTYETGEGGGGGGGGGGEGGGGEGGGGEEGGGGYGEEGAMEGGEGDM